MALNEPNTAPATEIIRNGDLQSGMLIALRNGTLTIDGEVSLSNSVPGMLYVETEAGVMYLDPDETTRVVAGH